MSIFYSPPRCDLSHFQHGWLWHMFIGSEVQLPIQRVTNFSISRTDIQPTSLQLTLHFPKQDINIATMLSTSSKISTMTTVSVLLFPHKYMQRFEHFPKSSLTYYFPGYLEVCYLHILHCYNSVASLLNEVFILMKLEIKLNVGCVRWNNPEEKTTPTLSLG